MTASARPLPRLSRALVCDPDFARRSPIRAPDTSMFALPERVVQFGTGAFLRSFVDDLIDEANRRGSFGGRVVAVASTNSGRDRRINDQDGLFTLAAQGGGLVGGE